MQHTKKYIPMIVVMIWALAGCSLWAVHAVAQDNQISLPAALDRVAIFSKLTDAEKQLLKTAATLKQGTKGAQIIFQDKAMKQMVILLDGHASVRVNGKQVAELSGEILLGEIEFLDGAAASADVFLLADTDYIALDNAALNQIMEAHPRLGYRVIREIARIDAPAGIQQVIPADIIPAFSGHHHIQQDQVHPARLKPLLRLHAGMCFNNPVSFTFKGILQAHPNVRVIFSHQNRYLCHDRLSSLTDVSR